MRCSNSIVQLLIYIQNAKCPLKNNYSNSGLHSPRYLCDSIILLMVDIEVLIKLINFYLCHILYKILF